MARVGFFVPAAVGIAHAAQTVVVSAVAHDDVHLADAVVGRYVDRFVLSIKMTKFK